MDKYVEGDRLYPYILSGLMSNAPAASWEDHRAIRNNKQSAMSQILSLERSTSLPDSLFLSLSPPSLYVDTYATRPHTLSLAGKHAYRLFPFYLSPQNHKHARPCITSSRWLDNLHQFELATKSPHHHNLITDSPSKNPVGVFHCVWEPLLLLEDGN